MGQALAAIVLILAIGGGAYWFGKSSATPMESTGFTYSTKLERATKLGVANTDITDIVEVCPSGSWLIFKGTGRALLVGANRYHYSLNWEPQKDIAAKPTGEANTHDLDVKVSKVEITMDTLPQIRVYTIDDSILVDMDRETAQFKERMLHRLQIMARNKLHTDEGRAELIDAIRNHLYKIYAGEKSRIRNIEVSVGEGAFGSRESPLFQEECTKPVATSRGAGMAEAAKKAPPGPHAIQMVAEKDGITVYRWASKK